MRKFLMGLVLPLALWGIVIYGRMAWKQDIHPGELAWWVWVTTLSVGSWLAGFGFRAYWWETSNQFRTRCTREDCQKFL